VRRLRIGAFSYGDSKHSHPDPRRSATESFRSGYFARILTAFILHFDRIKFFRISTRIRSVSKGIDGTCAKDA